MKKNTQLVFVLTAFMVFPLVSTVGAADHHLKPTSTQGDAVWAADTNRDGIMEDHGWLSYTVWTGITRRFITLTGTWAPDDSNLTGTYTIKNIALFKFLGVYKGLFYGTIDRDNAGVRVIGYFYNDWEVGYWTVTFPDTVRYQIVHIPFS